MRKFVPSLLLFCVIALPAFGADTVIEEIVARINNRIVTLTEYQRSRDELKQEVQQQDAATADKAYADREKDVLRDLIDQQLLLQKGADLSITGDTELIKQLDDTRRQMHLDTMDDLEKAAEAQGVSFEDYKQNIRNRIITQQVIRDEVGRRISITKEEEQKFYDEHKNEMQHPEQIHLSEILVAPQKPKSPGPAASEDQQDAAAKTKAEAILAQIRKGTSFEDVAKQFSDGPTAAQGGDLGYFQRGVMDKGLEEKTFAMKPGDVSDPIHTKQGFVILKVSEHQSAGIPSFKEMEPRLEEAVTMEKMQPALRAYLTKLREDAFYYVKPGFTDTGASPNQTQLVETATKESKAKELKKNKKKMVLF